MDTDGHGYKKAESGKRESGNKQTAVRSVFAFPLFRFPLFAFHKIRVYPCESVVKYLFGQFQQWKIDSNRRALAQIVVRISLDQLFQQRDAMAQFRAAFGVGGAM